MMSSPAGMAAGFTQWQSNEAQAPPTNANIGSNEDGVSVRPMRLKVLYTFDDQNKTNCLARWPHVLQIQTVAMDETTSIGVIELNTCIQAVVQCSPELVARLGQDYTIYAYDYSEYDNPLVGQGMLSRTFAAASPTPDAPASQSRQLITGRVCKNIMGLFANGVKETLEVKLRLVPVPTALQNQYVNTMEKYRELSKVIPAGFDPNEWNAFLQSNPNIGQLTNQLAAPANPNPPQRDGMSMEVVNQLLSPSLQQQTVVDPFNQASNAENSGTEGQDGAKNGGKAKKTASRPASRASVKRPRKPKTAAATGGNTSGYEEGTDGDDGPAPKKRAKITKTDWNSKSSFGTGSDSLRVTASTAGSLRLFRPIAMSPAPPIAGSHLQEPPRAPTPVPIMANQNLARDRAPSQSGLRRDSFASQVETRPHISPYPPLLPRPEDEVRDSIESANPSPERNYSPADTPPDIGSSPPVMRTRPPSPIRSSPPCPSSPVLPQMPRTDSGFMSGSLEDLFGEDDNPMRPIDDEDVGVIAKYSRRQAPRQPPPQETQQVFRIEQVIPGPVELLPTRMHIHERPPAKAATSARSRGGSVMSEDGQTLPPLKKSRATSHRPNMSQHENELQQPSPAPEPVLQPQPQPQPQQAQHVDHGLAPQQPPEQNVPPPAPQSRPGSRMMVRTASMGSLTLPAIPASDPVLPPSTLQRSQTWSEAPPHPMTEAPVPPMPPMSQMPPMPPMSNDSTSTVAYSRTFNAKKAAIKQKLEMAIANGEMPPFCSNCGAIETPTWRKAWSQEIQGAPGYHDYSDAPGKVTCIVILTRDDEGNPTSYQLIKKYLLQEENTDDFKEMLLCNPCGIWMSKYKTQRPPERWETGAPLERGDKKRPHQRPSRAKKSQPTNNMPLPTSEANFPQSEAYFPPSEAYFLQSEANFPQSEAYHPNPEGAGPADGVSPGDTTGMLQQLQQALAEQPQEPERQRSTSARPSKRLNAMISDAASAALKRAIQSSPARWAGTQHSPIEVEDDLGSTRRLLFPSPRKDGSPKVLGEVTTNVVQIATNFRSLKEQLAEATNKENCPPAFEAEGEDAELLKLFEEEMIRPTTPVQKTPPANPFKTPTRPTPNHRPITRSVSKSIRSAKSPGQLLTFSQTPTKTPRRSPRNHDAAFESPFTATLNQLMSEANNNNRSPTRNNLELDFSMPDLPLNSAAHNGDNVDMNFSLEDFFSTDVPMSSSPPKAFHLYEDRMANINWNEFNNFNSRDMTNGGEEVVVKAEPEEEQENEEENGDAEMEQSA